MGDGRRQAMSNLADRAFLDEMPEGFFEVDPSGSFVCVNPAFCRLMQRPAHSLVGTNFREYATAETAEVLVSVFKRVHDSDGIPSRMEFEVGLPDGTRATVEISVTLLRNQTGVKVGFCGLAYDITRRKRLEERLMESRERFEALFENANELIITTDEYGYIIRLNKKVEETSGYARDELVGKSILTIAYRDDRDIYLKFWRDLLGGKRPSYELRAISKDGRRVEYLLASGSVLKKEGKIIEVQYNAQVITPLKEAQQTIEGLKNHLKSIIESSPNVTVCLNRDATIDMANPVTEKLFRIPLASLPGRRIADLNPRMQPFEELIDKVLTSGTPHSLRDQILTDHTGQVFDVNIYPLANSPSGGVVFTAMDVTEKKDMELQLIHAQKMETIGQLAGGIAHDFNNILTGISGNLTMLKLTQDRNRQERYIQTLENITKRAIDLITQMLLFTKRNDGLPVYISIGQVVQEVLEITTRSVPKHIEVHFPRPDKEYCVLIDHTQLTQVIMNLILNAVDAIPPENTGRIGIHVQPVSVDDLPTTGRYARIDVTDTGCGMDEETLPRIFDPFFTTKTKGSKKGTGLGLSITYTIIRNAGGGIQVQSQKDAGSRFSILLPLVDACQQEAPHEEQEHPPTRLARILLVDDEDMLRDIGKEMLEFLGHEVVTASNGRDCLAILSSDARGFDLIILDMIMPGLDGYHTLQEMSACGLETKVVISSGFSFEHEDQDLFSSPLIVGRLNKPFNIQDLMRTITEVLA